jgi:hypothetical protein
MRSDLVEVLGGVQAEMAGEAVAILQGAGMAFEVRVAPGVSARAARPDSIGATSYVYVAATDLERARVLLAERGFPIRPTGADETLFEDEAAGTAPADASVSEFLRRKP